MKIKFLSILMIFPALLQGLNFGLSVPVGIVDNEDLSYGSFGKESAVYEYRYGTGVGVVIDTNVVQENTFGYRLAFEYTVSDLYSSTRDSVTSLRRNKFEIVNTFAFGVVQEPKFKWWVGPRLNMQFIKTSGSNISYQNSWGFGVAAATGINYKIAERVALATDIEYHGNMMFGGESYQDDFSVFFGTTTGATIRFYLLFVFEDKPKGSSVSLDSDNSF